MPTSTTSFGTSKRESHDSSPYYEFVKGGQTQDLLRRMGNDDQGVGHVRPDLGMMGVDQIFNHSSTDMRELADNSVALMVTSPPYNVGKEYEEPQPFDDYLDMLNEVFAETYRVLEVGGRAAINVANLGRKPYTPLTSYVDAMCLELGFLPRAQIIWQKGEGANGSCAWGSFQSASNPVIRDLHEYVLVYSKGQYGRVKGKSTISKEDFLRDTLSIWKIQPASAKRVGHPAPFPVELPTRLINLYTYEDDLILDPFLGSGSTAVAATQLNRHYVGYETDANYITLAERRIQEETQRGSQDLARRQQRKTSGKTSRVQEKVSGQGQGAESQGAPEAISTQSQYG